MATAGDSAETGFVVGVDDKVAVTAGDFAILVVGVDDEATSVATWECGLLEHDKSKNPTRTMAAHGTRIASLFTMLSRLLFLVRRDFRQDRRLQQPFLFFFSRVHRQPSRSY